MCNVQRRLAEGFPGVSVVENLPANAGDVGSVSVSERSPWEGTGNPLQCSCLGNPMDRETWQATVPGIIKSRAWLSMHARTHAHWTSWHFFFHFFNCGKIYTTLSSPLAVVSSAAMNTCIQVFVWTSDFSSFGYISRSGIAGPYGSSVFNLKRNP